MSAPTCEWAKRSDDWMHKCGRPAKARATATGGEWGRNVCGIHARVAERHGWIVTDLADPSP